MTANRPPSTLVGSAAPRSAAGSRAWLALLLLLSINLFNYIDRQVLAAVEPDIRASLLPADDEFAGTKMGLLSTAFLVSYMVAAPLFGFLAERTSRWLLIALGVAIWSLASGGSGWARSYAALLITRCFVGIGEAAYGPVAPTLLSDLYPVSVRGRVLAWFYMAMPVGGALGYALGEQAVHWFPGGEGWRWAFYLVVPPGLLLGLWAFLMRDPPRGASDALAAPPRRATWADYLVLLRTRSYVLNTLGMTAMTFAIGALAFWMPRYLVENEVGEFLGMKPRFFFGVVTAVAGLFATLAGGIAGDALRARFSGSYFLVSGVGLLLAGPCCLLFLAVAFPWAWLFVFLAVFFVFFNTGPTNTILANVTHPSMRAAAFGLNIFVIHVFGDAISPPVVGAIRDRFSLESGFLLVSLFTVVGGVIWLYGARYLERDTAAAPHLLEG